MAVAPPVRRIVRLRAVRFLVRLLVLSWTRFIWPAWRWCKRSVHLVRAFLGRHEVWYWMVAWGCCGALAYAILQSPPQKVGIAVAGVIVLVALVRRVEWAIAAVIVLAASFMHHGAIPRPVSLGGMGPDTTELLILTLLATVFVRSCRQGKLLLFKSPMTLPLILLYLSVIMSMLESYRLFRAADAPDLFYLGQIYNNARPLFFYFFFFVVAFGIQTERQLRFVIRAVVWMAALVGLMVAAQYYLGDRFSLFAGGEWSPSYSRALSPEEEDITRTMPPGLALISIFFLVSMAYAAYHRSRNGVVNALAAVAMGVGLLFSFYRSFWASTALGLFIIWIASAGIIKRRLLAYGATAIVVIIVGTMSFASLVPGSAGEGFARGLTNRFTSLLDSQTYKSDESLQARLRENSTAIQRIKQNPIFGIGSGTPRQYRVWTRPGSYTRVIFPLNYIHNSYLELWMVYGILGVISFTWLSIAFLIRCFMLFRRVKDPSWKSFAIACFAGYIGYLIRCFTQPHIVHDTYYMIVTALIWGSIEVIARLHGEGRLSEPADPASPQAELPPGTGVNRRGHVGLSRRANSRVGSRQELVRRATR